MKRVVLIGLPNVGKNTIFNRLINSKISISTHPGSALEVKSGLLKIEGEEVEIIDIPSVYNLFSSADNEVVARNILIDEKPDLVVQVADTKNLKRSLTLTSLLAEFKIPLMLTLNMADEAAQKGIKIKRHKLEEMLGVPVIETVASEGVGIASLISALETAKIPCYPSRLPETLDDAAQGLIKLMADAEKNSGKSDSQWVKRALALFSLAGDKEASRWAMRRSEVDDEAAHSLIEETRRSFYQPLDQIIARASDNWANGLYVESVFFTPVTSTPILNRIGDLALTPIAGTLILFLLLTAIYFVVGKFAAGVVVDFLVKDFFGDMAGPYLHNAVAMIPSPFLRDLLVGEYGIYTMALIPAFGLVLPVIVVFFFTFGLIDDSGYFSRLSVLLNKLFRKIGLNGKAVLPMILGFSCVTMATIATRILDSKRERFIAIFLLSLGVPCSAKLSLILVILAQVSFSAFLVVFGVIFALTVATGFILNKLMPVEESHFIMEIPPIRIPSLKNVTKQTFYRSRMFLREALPLFILSAAGLFVMEKLGLLKLVEDISSPVIKGFLGLPPQFAESLILGFIRGEAGVAVLKKMVDNGTMDHLQLVVAMIVTILFIPCVTNFLLIIKEQGTKKAFAIIVSVTVCAIMTGGIMNWFLRWSNFTF